MNILKMKAEDAQKLIDEILDDITKEDLVKELQNSGFNIADTVNNLHKLECIIDYYYNENQNLKNIIECLEDEVNGLKDAYDAAKDELYHIPSEY